MDTTFSGPQMGLIGDLMIVNFSSPHEFNFVGGRKLPACSPEWANKMKLLIEEEECMNPKGFTDVKLKISLTKEVLEALDALQGVDHIDVILVPFMVLQALKDEGRSIGKCRCIRTADRVTKEIYADKFCV